MRETQKGGADTDGNAGFNRAFDKKETSFIHSFIRLDLALRMIPTPCQRHSETKHQMRTCCTWRPPLPFEIEKNIPSRFFLPRD
mmetsp:Transcript_908/g.1795  ORF Transcript_908/g.1795 Transcript_908/m.1795 type:complete len:84 (+) Transcript_908:120-371(+)